MKIKKLYQTYVSVTDLKLNIIKDIKSFQTVGFILTFNNTLTKYKSLYLYTIIFKSSNNADVVVSMNFINFLTRSLLLELMTSVWGLLLNRQYLSKREWKYTMNISLVRCN